MTDLLSCPPQYALPLKVAGDSIKDANDGYVCDFSSIHGWEARNEMVAFLVAAANAYATPQPLIPAQENVEAKTTDFLRWADTVIARGKTMKTDNDILDRLQEYSVYGDDAKVRIMAALAKAEIERLRALPHGSGPAQSMTESGETVAISDRLANIMTWLREPDWTEQATLEWIEDWVNRRPIAELAMVAMLMPSARPGPSSWQPTEAREKEITRLATIEECAQAAEQSLIGHTLTSGGLARQNEAEEIAARIRGLAVASTERK
jgi:hypothetical protein